jgi:hypothetical protein
MAACENGSCAVRYRNREEKRNEYKHDFTNARDTWQGLRDDLFRIGHQYFDCTADIPDIEESLHDVWNELIHAAKIIPSISSEHDRLLTLVITVRELGNFSRKLKNAIPGGDEEVATMANGQRLWTDVPYLAQDFQDYWTNESIVLPAIERENLAVLTAKLCGAGVCSIDLARCALWLFKETLETERPLIVSSSGGDHSKGCHPPVSELLPACIEWLTYSNSKLARLSADNCNPASWSEGGEDRVSIAPGPLATKANVIQQGFSVSRWLFWRQRLGEMYLSGDQQVAKSARKCFEVMALTGLAVGIEIPGEKKYLERLFEALDKELAARNGKGSVGPEDIEIDPAWPIDE